MAVGRGRGDGGGSLPAGARTAGRCRHVAGDAADVGRVAGPGRALRPAAGAGVPPGLAPGLSPRRLGGGHRARRADGSGVPGGGAAGADRHRGLCGGAQPAGVDRLVVPGEVGLMTDGGGPAAQRNGRVSAGRRPDRRHRHAGISLASPVFAGRQAGPAKTQRDRRGR